MESAIQVTLLRLPAVTKATGLKPSWVYELMGRNEFPQSVKLGPRARAWRSDEIQEFILSRPRTNEEPKIDRQEAA